MARKERVPVLIDVEVYEKFKSLAGVTGAPVTRVVNSSLADWFESVGEVRMDALRAAGRITAP